MRPPRDILAIALRNLRVGEELFCLPTTHAKIVPRVQAIQHDHPPLRFNLYRRDGLGYIRRTR
jgi:hypothetical protein